MNQMALDYSIAILEARKQKLLEETKESEQSPGMMAVHRSRYRVTIHTEAMQLKTCGSLLSRRSLQPQSNLVSNLKRRALGVGLSQGPTSAYWPLA